MRLCRAILRHIEMDFKLETEYTYQWYKLGPRQVQNSGEVAWIKILGQSFIHVCVFHKSWLVYWRRQARTKMFLTSYVYNLHTKVHVPSYCGLKVITMHSLWILYWCTLIGVLLSCLKSLHGRHVYIGGRKLESVKLEWPLLSWCLYEFRENMSVSSKASGRDSIERTS